MTSTSRPMAASRNHGNRSNDTNNSRSATSSQKPRRDTLVTSTAEVRFPSRVDVILCSLKVYRRSERTRV